ncbi:MAG TPA: 8-amino-7-oxononanoate synthase [Pirellulales bacterium]|nr:8-amino-7-oxononanoate synthase [Pirellulales bacterium]
MTANEHPLDWIDDELTTLQSQNLLRHQFAHAGPAGATIDVNGRRCVNFGSNDYLGLAADPRVTEAARACIEREGWGSAASPLLAGRGTAHAKLEAELAEFEGTEAAIVFSSGFAANLATVIALAGRGDCILADETNHASLIDGCRLSRAEVRIYAHGDWRSLEKMLAATNDVRRRLIVTDGLFSMDGDLAPLVELTDLAERYGAMLLVDEAHATGVFGASGRGSAEHFGVADRVSIRVGTLSKALGGVGGFVCGRRSLIDWLVNRARPYIFSTAPPAAACAAASAALRIVREEPQRRVKSLSRAAGLRGEFARQGWDIGRSVSQIIPLVVGEPARALQLAGELARRGFYVPAIRPPSVAPGQSRLRIGLSAAHDDTAIDGLLRALAQLAEAIPADAR